MRIWHDAHALRRKHAKTAEIGPLSYPAAPWGLDPVVSAQHHLVNPMLGGWRVCIVRVVELRHKHAKTAESAPLN